MSYEDERAEQIAAAEVHLRDMKIVDVMDSALYNFNPSLHEEAPGFAHAVFALIRAYERASAQSE